ncbi:MAG: hypothetical protein HY723_01960 [Chloroflexi bacterium]|nr:hypothetical protein [Chloroflexota bacterium]
MPIEKAFAIHAEPAAIWRTLHSELDAAAGEGGYEIDQAVPNELLSLWVEIQRGIRANLTYRLIPRDGHTEVVATMYPQGLRYAIFRILTLGRADTNYELLLVEGLANLKRAVEDGPCP